MSRKCVIKFLSLNNDTIILIEYSQPPCLAVFGIKMSAPAKQAGPRNREVKLS